MAVKLKNIVKDPPEGDTIESILNIINNNLTKFLSYLNRYAQTLYDYLDTLKHN